MPSERPSDIVEVAKKVEGGKPDVSYVTSAQRMAKFILENQWQLPGWTCPHCGIFNGAEKEWLKTCRSCGETYGTIPTVETNK